MLADMAPGDLVAKISELEAQVTVIKAERDENIRLRLEVEQTLNDLLARIHRDGGHFIADHGITRAVEVAHDLVVAEHVTADKLKFAKATIVKLADLATCYLTCEVDPTEERVAEIEALRNVGEMS